LFDRAAKIGGMDQNPLEAYTIAKDKASGLVRKFETRAYKMLKRIQRLANLKRTELGVHMRDITLSNINPEVSLRHADNDHIWTKRNKKTGKRRLRKRFKDIAPRARSNYKAFKKSDPKAAKLLLEMATLSKDIHNKKIDAALFSLGEMFELDPVIVKALRNARTDAEIDALFDDKEVGKIKDEIDNPTGQLFKKEGKKRKKLLKKALSEAETRAQVASSAKTIIRESSIKGWYFPLRRYGDFVVSSGEDVTGDDRYMSLHSTQAEAESIAAKLREQGVEVFVSGKIQSAAATSDVKAVVSDLTRRIKDGDTRKRLKGALVELMAANAAYQSQIKRKNVDGVAADDMARGFEEYVSVSKYTIGDLLISHKVSEALNNMNSLIKEEGLTSDDRILINDVVNEIKNQNRGDSDDRAMSGIQKGVGLVGFLNFLGSPAYWALNATQTYTITIPYITAKWGIGSTSSLIKAQATVLKAFTAALNSSDKSYEGFKAQLPPAARKVVEELESRNIIQSTIAHEFGDIISPTTMNRWLDNAYKAPVAKTVNAAMTVMEKVPEAVEHFNRISTALAIYELSSGDLQATMDGVQATQFNYDTGNRARLLKNLPGKKGAGRSFVSPIMMFKTHGIGVARLFYGSIFDAVVKKQGRAEAIKLATGLIVSHTIFGGVAGGLMVAPIKAIQWAINQALEPDDEWDMEEGIEEWAREIAGDTAATLARRGIPGALGFDLTRSINLGNLIFMGNDRLDPSEYGDVQQMLFQLAGPVAMYGANAYTEGARLLSGDNRGGFWEFAEAAVPVKMVRGMIQGTRMLSEGIVTDGGLELVPKVGVGTAIISGLGFQPTAKTEPVGRYYSDKALERRRGDRKSQLIERLQERVLEGEPFEDIIADILRYNASVPEAQYRITSGDRARLQSRRRTNQREYDKEYKFNQRRR